MPAEWYHSKSLIYVERRRKTENVLVSNNCLALNDIQATRHNNCMEKSRHLHSMLKLLIYVGILLILRAIISTIKPFIYIYIYVCIPQFGMHAFVENMLFSAGTLTHKRRQHTSLFSSAIEKGTLTRKSACVCISSSQLFKIPLCWPSLLLLQSINRYNDFHKLRLYHFCFKFVYLGKMRVYF